MEPRSAAASGRDFPYRSPTTCYIEVHQDGKVTQGADRAAYERARSGESRLFAVWPGQWRSDLFVIDDLDVYARALGIIHDEERTGLADHNHEIRWAISPYENKPDGTYISIEVWLDCGCTIRDLDVFAAQMQEQRGWDIAKSGGWGSGGGSYRMRARRRSLAD
jgi:hypothetical protein